jgi:hypothetical protein
MKHQKTFLPQIDGLSFGAIKEQKDLKLRQNYFHTEVYGGDSNSCGPKALSVLSHLPFETVNSALIQKNYRKSGIGTRTTLLTRMNEDIFTEVLGCRGVTVAGFIKTVADPNKLYLVRTHCHVQAVLGKTLVNTWNGGRRARIWSVWEVSNTQLLRDRLINRTI